MQIKRYKVKINLVIILFVSFFLSNCASIIHGNKQVVPVSSNPTGAQVTVDGQLYYTSPCEMILDRDKPYIITLTLDGYQTEQILLDKGFSIWFFVGIIPGAILPGPIYDLVTGSAFQLSPPSVSVTMKKLKKK